MKHSFSAAAIAILFALSCGCSSKSSSDSRESADSGSFTVTFLDVGKADSMVLQTENHTVIIDCGEKNDGKDILDFLDENQITSVDYLIITHYDKDHIGGAPKLIKNLDISAILAPDYEETSNEFEKYSETADEYNLSPQLVTTEISFTLDGVDFTVYPPERSDYGEDDDNDFSLAITAEYGSSSFLFTGDAMEQRVDELVNLNLGNIDVIKIPYHGNEIENLSELIDKIQPEYAVISTDEDTLSDATAELLDEKSIETYSTCYDGQITFQSDGTDITVTTE